MVHLGIIPDGNRRWCKINNYKLEDLPKKWIEFTVKIIKQCKNLNELDELNELNEINEISIYISSIDNINRNDNTKNIIEKTIEEMIDIINNVEEKYENKFDDDTKNFIKDIFKNYIEINLIGDINKLSKKNYKKKYVLNIAYAYDYNKDILNEKNKDNENYNRIQSNIDLIIRSGGEKRLSGFFPTKTIYSELFFLDKLWLDVDMYDIRNILLDYKKRNRRFGK
jgi:undecaprenyl pyrophosphate synthase